MLDHVLRESLVTSAFCGLALLIAVTWACMRRASAPAGRVLPPTASGALPVLGHALEYKKNPAAFLTAQHRLFSGAFRLNLAGFRTMVVSDEQAVKQVVNASESVLSERQGVADFGFLEGLGDLNVFLAVSAHKRIIRCIHGAESSLRPFLIHCATEAVSQHISPGRHDLIPTMRRVMLQMAIHLAMGPRALDLYPCLIKDYIDFQESLEDAIASAAVLPGFLAAPKLRRVGAARKCIVDKLAACIPELWAQVDTSKCGGKWCSDVEQTALTADPAFPGVWLYELKGMALCDLPGWDDYVAHRVQAGGRLSGEEAAGRVVTPRAAAEIVISLLFAAHKNPSIGASQTLLMAMESPPELERLQSEIEAFSDAHLKLKAPLGKNDPNAETNHQAEICSALSRPGVLEQQAPRLGCSISEACRLTAHTIGTIRKVAAAGGIEVECSGGARYWAPPNSYIAVSHIAVSLDDGIFPEAEKFSPERFAGGEGLIRHSRLSEYHYTTFSQGLHKCPGQRMAMLMMKLVLMLALDRFHMQPAASIPPLDFSRATLAQRAGECLVDFAHKR